MNFPKVAFLLGYLTSLSASAEYRAFELRITHTQSGEERLVTSTLDHVQYSQYYPLNRDEVIDYVDSWMCWENTAPYHHTPICPKPVTAASSDPQEQQSEP